ncbi:MAG: hypothetical protein JXA67_13545 [Micromonosporaceae bacterium]|nr:hypothetical protein [Micromonosporaceae bacterium]
MTQTIDAACCDSASSDVVGAHVPDAHVVDTHVPAPRVEPGQPATSPVGPTMEEALAETERAIEDAVKSAAVATVQLKRALTSARTGQMRDLRKALASAESSAAALAEQVRNLHTGFEFNEQQYLASGEYIRELLALAEERGVSMYQEDDQLLCYPSLVRVVSADANVEIDKVKERRLRPSVLIAHLARNQDRAPRFRAEAFLDALRDAYDLRILKEGKKPDGIVRLVDIWQVLTLLPQGGKYSKQEFARDLYLLDQSGVVSTQRNPRELRWSASTGTKGAGKLTTVSRTGQHQQYWGISFTCAAPES